MSALLLSSCSNEAEVQTTSTIETSSTSAITTESNSTTVITNTATTTTTSAPPESVQINLPPDNLSEEEPRLWGCITEQVDKPIAMYYNIADYDSDGKLEMFIMTNETGEHNIESGEHIYCSFHQTNNTIYYTDNCDLYNRDFNIESI